MASRVPPKRKSYSDDGRLFSLPCKRIDDELYDRPKPDPFHLDWCEGYDDGLAGEPHWKKIRIKPDYYADGYKSGTEEREALDNLGSSNA